MAALRLTAGCIRVLVKEQFAYLWDSIFRGSGALVHLFVHSAIWLALYQDRSAMDGITLMEMMTYVVLAQIAASVTEFELGSELETLVRTGDIGSRLIRPVDYRVYHVLTSIAYVISSLLTRGTAVLGAALLFYELQPAPSISHILAYVVLLIGAFLLAASINMCFAVTSLIRLEPKQFQWILMGLSAAASGAFVPLWFYPEWLRQIVDVLPLRLFRFVPVSMFLGHIDLSELPYILLEQLAWSVLFISLSIIVWQHGIRRLTAFGG